jgi:hypothetical protein
MLDKPAVQDFCLACGAAIWKAQSCGFSVKADCLPVDVATEIECFLTKRSTYGVWKEWQRFYLDYRWLGNINRQYEFVLTQHKCGSAQSVMEHPIYWPLPQLVEPNF